MKRWRPAVKRTVYDFDGFALLADTGMHVIEALWGLEMLLELQL